MNQHEPIFFTPPRDKLNRQLYKGGGKQPSSTTQTVTQQLPAYAQPFATELMQRGAALSRQDYKPYDGQRIADLNQSQQTGIKNIQNQALGGFQGQRDAGDLYQQTVRGDFLHPESNPYLQATANSIGNNFNRTVGAQNASMQRTAGAFGNSGLHQKMSMDNAGLAGQLSNLYGQNYNFERGNQLSAMQLAPVMQNMGYTDSKQLLGAGDIQRSYMQDLLNSQYGDWTAAQNQPLANLDILRGAISGSIGNAGTTLTKAPNPYQASPFANMVGGGLSGAALGGQLFGGNGGLIGGLLGAAGAGLG